MTFQRQHPIKILGYTTRNFWLLSIPLIRGLVYYKFDFESWIHGAWFDILIVLSMLIFAILRWLSVSFAFNENNLYYKKGIFLFQESEIAFTRITSVGIENKFYLIPFKAATLSIDTNAGTKRKSDMTLILSRKNIDTFSNVYNKVSSKKLRMIYSPSRKHLVFFSFVFSNTLSGVILLSTLIFQSGKIVGNQLEQTFFATFTSYTQKMTKNISPATLAIALVILGGWFISFCINLLRYWNFSCERKGSNIVVRNGFLTKRISYLNRKNINYIDLRQSLSTILFKISSVHVHCTGYGKAKNAIAVLVPITVRQEVTNTMKMLLPDYPEAKTTVNTSRFQIRRLIFFPILSILLIILLALALLYILPDWSEMIYLASIIVLIPLAWLLIVKIVSDYTTGIGCSSGFLILKYCRFYEFHNVIVPIDKVSLVEIRQSFAQKPTDNCNIKIYTNAERTKYHLINFLAYSEVLEFLEQNNISYMK